MVSPPNTDGSPSSQGNYSLVGRELEREVPPYCTYAGLGVLPHGPLGGGRTPAQVALNWVTNRPEVTSALIGARTVDQLEDNLGSVGWLLDPEHVDRLNEASRFRIGYPQEFQQWMANIGM